MKIYKAGLLILCMLMGSVVIAQDFNSYDSDSDNRISQTEFEELNRNTFYNYDEDSDGNITNEEFYRATYGEFDKNQDGSITENEWNNGVNNNTGSLSADHFTTFDTSGDGSLDEDEWNYGMRLSNEWYNSFDFNTDESITNEEWNESNFDQWDDNDDNFIDEKEFEMRKNDW